VPTTPILNLRVDAERKARWQRAADRSDVKLSEWIRMACDTFAVGGVIARMPVEVNDQKAKRR